MLSWNTLKIISRSTVLAAVIASLSFSLASAFSSDSGSAVCTVDATKAFVRAVSDGAGGAIVVWVDHRENKALLYAQRIDNVGRPIWSENGIPLSAISGSQYPEIIPDGAGGAIVAWMVYRSQTFADIQAQRVSPQGTPLWGVDGVAVCTAANEQNAPSLASDGANGAIICWGDWRTEVADVFAQRVNAQGIPQWVSNGVPVCSASYYQLEPVVASDGSGGAIIAWRDNRTNAEYHLYAQRVNSVGMRQWTTDGVALCLAPSGGTFSFSIISDGHGGAITVWNDNRTPAGMEVYCQRVSANGVPQWMTNGVRVGAGALPTMVPDGQGGANIAWEGVGGGGTGLEILAQRVAIDGTPQWRANGVFLTSMTDDQVFPAITSDGAGGAIVTWQDRRTLAYYDIYAARVDGNGYSPGTLSGIALCTAPNDQESPVISSDGSGGAMVAWLDHRSGSHDDVYAQHVAVADLVLEVPGIDDVNRARAWPNPFTTQVSVSFTLSAATPVRMEVFDIAGRSVWSSRTEMLGPGRHTKVWDSPSRAGEAGRVGIYFLSISGPGFSVRTRVIHLE